MGEAGMSTRHPDPRKRLAPRNQQELYRRLKEAEDLLRRGIAVSQRVGWEPGETAVEWAKVAAVWVSVEEMEREIFGEPVFE